jgi:uncharacterized protein Usg
MLMPVPLLLRIYYYLPDRPLIIAPEFILQIDDIVPSIPRVNSLLTTLHRDTGVTFQSIELSGGNIGARKLRHVDGMFQLH